MKFSEEIKQLKAIQSRLSAYYHAMSLIFYDGATTAPKGTAENRAHALGILSEESYKLNTGEETVGLLELLDAHIDELSAEDARMVELMYKDIKELKKIPIEEYVAYQELLVRADDVWHRAKETSDFELFKPVLEEIFASEKRFAALCAPDKKPYDYCLDKYESGLTTEKCDEFFSTLKASIVPLIAKIQKAQQIDDSCIHGSFDLDAQRKLSIELMKNMGIDLEYCGIGEMS